MRLLLRNLRIDARMMGVHALINPLTKSNIGTKTGDGRFHRRVILSPSENPRTLFGKIPTRFCGLSSLTNRLKALSEDYPHFPLEHYLIGDV
jgi:hypothetical protein